MPAQKRQDALPLLGEHPRWQVVKGHHSGGLPGADSLEGHGEDARNVAVPPHRMPAAIPYRETIRRRSSHGEQALVDQTVAPRTQRDEVALLRRPARGTEANVVRMQRER